VGIATKTFLGCWSLGFPFILGIFLGFYTWNRFISMQFEPDKPPIDTPMQTGNLLVMVPDAGMFAIEIITRIE